MEVISNMSNFKAMSKTPDMKKYKVAIWWDNYFGNHHYGVEFPDGTIVNPELVKIKTRKFRKNEYKLSEFAKPISWFQKFMHSLLKY